MKKLQICMLLVLCMCLLAGCKKKIPSLIAEDIKVNTILVRDNKTVQACVVEDFSKDYYSKEGLEQYIQTAISEYATIAGEKAVVMDSLEVVEAKAKVVFTYATMEDYAAFNDMESEVLTAAEAMNDERMPESFVAAKESAKVDKAQALSKKEYTIVIINEPLDVIIDGSVVYYANGLLLDKKTVQSADEGTTVIVYK